jgi:hypothetical protein
MTTICNIKQKGRAKRKFLQLCKSSGPKKWMDDIEVNGRLAWMCMGTSACCVMKATEYACNGYISWPSL